jgi:flagellar biosynthesis chaperone FliJ
MAVSRALRRLLCVLEVEEDQCRLALESQVGQLAQLERALTATQDRAQRGRKLVHASARNGELPDRLAGIEETHAARRRAEALVPRIADAQLEVESLRQAFLSKRIECRQAETLISEAEAMEALVADRRGQQALDDWYLNRLHARNHAGNSSKPAGSIEAQPGTHPATDEA